MLTLARSLVVAASVNWGRERFELPLTPKQTRQLGRAIEAMVGFEDHRRAVEAGHAGVRADIAAHAALAARATLDDAMATLERARAEFRKALWLHGVACAWGVVSLAVWWLA